MLSGLYMWGDAATNMVIPDKAGGRFENPGGGGGEVVFWGA